MACRDDVAAFGYDGLAGMARLCQLVGVLAQPVAGALDLYNNGMVLQSVEQCRGHDRIAEHLAHSVKPRLEVRFMAPFPKGRTCTCGTIELQRDSQLCGSGRLPAPFSFDAFFWACWWLRRRLVQRDHCAESGKGALQRAFGAWMSPVSWRTHAT